MLYKSIIVKDRKEKTKMKIRTLTALALTGALVMSLTACGETEETTVETTVAETSIEETTEASIVEVTDESIDETVTDETVGDTVVAQYVPDIYMTYIKSTGEDTGIQLEPTFITNVQTTNFEVMETEFEGITAYDNCAYIGQDIVITFESDEVLSFNNLYVGPDDFGSVVDGVDTITFENTDNTYTITIPADLVIENDIYNYYYLVLNVGEGTDNTLNLAYRVI